MAKVTFAVLSGDCMTDNFIRYEIFWWRVSPTLWVGIFLQMIVFEFHVVVIEQRISSVNLNSMDEVEVRVWATVDHGRYSDDHDFRWG